MPKRICTTKDLESYLEQGRAYHTLTLRDLVEARDAYHVFLTRKKNVIGTAIGKYRIRKNGVPMKAAKTLENSEVRSYSWPCVLVFVDDWIDEAKFGKTKKALSSDYLPQRLYLPDGREIPVCVVMTAWGKKGPDAIARLKFPGSVIGGGYPVMTRVQGEERWATFGCLVSDGRTTYAMTNAHVSGRPGESLFTVKNGNEIEIGVSSRKQLGKTSFSEVYETYPGRHTLVNQDIGLIELNDLHGVTSQIFGLKTEIRGIADVNHDTLSLRLIGCPVIGYGCSSGEMEGEVVGLFYRYANSGGYEYVADYLIGPRNRTGSASGRTFSPRNGDSGTLLVIDDPDSSEHGKAIAVLWGGQRDQTGKNEQPYGLATNMATICRQLDVELVCNWNTGYDRYFGAYAHVVLPSLCAGVVRDKSLRKLMENNAERFSMPLGGTAVKETKGLSKLDFVPLSDVPDLVWKSRSGAYRRGREGANHFADMDQPNSKKVTLLELCETAANIEPVEWVKYYKDVGSKDKGALPFRIAQIYDEMTKSVRKGDADRFVCAAGILTHYVFDACMPLHISYMHHGDPHGEMKTVTSKGKDKEVPIAYDVHGEFDNQMVEYFVSTIEDKLPDLVQKKAATSQPATLASITSPRKAAEAAIALMRNTVTKHANPIKIVRDYEDLVDRGKKERCTILWKKYGNGYLQAMAEAVVLSARLWEAAWNNGGGSARIKTTTAIPEDSLRELYESKEFLESVNLEDITGTMDWQ